jgi:hypothetical protein
MHDMANTKASRVRLLPTEDALVEVQSILHRLKNQEPLPKSRSELKDDLRKDLLRLNIEIEGLMAVASGRAKIKRRCGEK